MSQQFYQLKVAAIQKPIEAATSITFDVPPHLYEQFDFRPGQHLIIKLLINGEEVRRTYSLNSSPFAEEALQITVKRVKNGLVSNYLNDNLKVGDTLDVMTPQGKFFADITAEAYKTYFLFAAGSGITPIMSILKSVLYASPYSVVHLFYGNMHQDSIICKAELDALQAEYAKRLTVVHTLSNPKIWTVWEAWKGRKGRIDAAQVEWFITEYPPIAQSTEYYICGPGAMNVSIRKTLLDLGIPKDLVHIEQFGGQIADLKNDIAAIDNAKLVATLNGKTYTLNVPKGTTILQSLKAAKASPPYSCESGVCATCVATMTKGKAEMKACMALEEKDIAKAKILTCQALPTTDEVHISFDIT